MDLKKMLFALPLGLLLLAGCEKDEEVGGLAMTFKANYDGAPLVMLDEYDYDGGLSLTFQRFNFFISDVALVSGATKEDILDIEFVDFDNDATAEEANIGFTVLKDNIPAGDYTQLRIGLGVPVDLNATTDSDYSGSDPLARPSHYWPGWESFIFTMINAKVDSNGDGIHDDSSVLYHTGGNETYRLIEYTIPIRIELDKVTDVEFSIDLKDLFADGNGGYIDILTNTNTHDITNLTIANQVMDNFTQALKILN